MRALLAVLMVPLLIQAADLKLAIPIQTLVHPVQTWHSAPAGHRLMAIVDGAMESFNAIDYATTRIGAFPGRGGCELNPLLVTAPCRIDVPRFSAVKLAIALFGVVQWAPVFGGWSGNTYATALSIVDAALALPLAIADANNIYQLTK